MALPPNRIKEWRQKRRLTMQQLAESADTTRSQIDKLEKGDRRLSVDWMVRLAKPLGCEARELLPLEGPSFETVSFTPITPSSLPVRNWGPDGTFMSAPVDRTPCPPFLAHTKDAYAFYVPDDTMVPMFRPRQMIYVNPYKPPVEGGGVVVMLKNGQAYLAELKKQKSSRVICKTYNPIAEMTFSVTDILALHAVVGTMEPF